MIKFILGGITGLLVGIILGGLVGFLITILIVGGRDE